MLRLPIAANIGSAGLLAGCRGGLPRPPAHKPNMETL
jgi:hypothetical protein